jgi:ribonuclease HII
MSQAELFPKTETIGMGQVERQALDRDYQLIIGVDEAGRGPLAGPVQVAAVALVLDGVLEAEWLAEMNDSKKLSESKRDTLFDLVKEHALAYEIVSYDREKIDDLNILQATRAAMKEAVEAVAEKLSQPVDRVYIDGNQKIDIDLAQTTVVKGDGRSYHIAAASVLAKVSRDRLMVEYDEQWPEYGFAKHKGYGTKAHRAAIAEHGPCDIHRHSFAGVKEHLPDRDDSST